MKKIIGFFTSTYFLAVFGLLVVGLSIWFVGPLLAFDTLRPLASVGMRVTVIVLLLCLAVLVLKRLPVTALGLVALSILVWHGGPLFKVDGTAPLASELARILAICVLVVPYLVWGLINLGRTIQRHPDWFRKMFGIAPNHADKTLAETEIKALGGIVDQALARLKQMRTSARGLARLLEGRRYLHELPWYMIIGNPGAGKTSALLNAGLKLPLPEQMDRASQGREPAGTQHCVWWLTNEAVLIDTAGHYAHHESCGDAAKSRAEWAGFLGLLRKHRPRAPVNGAIVAINIAEFLGKTAAERAKLAADMRGRVMDLRESLGIRFPVYVVFTKMDLMAGFEAYFSTLTAEGRGQPWGFALPYGKEATGPGESGLKAWCAEALEALALRLDAGLTTRLRDEFDPERRRQLSLLPQEFEALIEPLSEILEAIFRDSRYDGTQASSTLRGVYFTSAAQAPASLIANPATLWQRLSRAFAGKRPEEQNALAGLAAAVGNRSYFLHDLFHRLIFREAHLVRPNLRWETRFRLLRLAGHALAILLCAWLLSGIWVSSRNNAGYLAQAADNAQTLSTRMEQYVARPDNARVPRILSDVQNVPASPGLDLVSPATSWRFGLYTPTAILEASSAAYAALEDRLLLPFVVRRMETALAETIRRGDEARAYETLRAYLLLNDKDRYVARDVAAWTRRDWEAGRGGETFDGNPEVLRHIQALLNGSRVVQSPLARNEALIREARAYLESKPSTTRVYERLKNRMAADAPEDFTLLLAVGPQAGTIFSLKSGASLDRGIGGMFTYAGYHELFNKRLPELLQFVHEDDTWVMGRRVATFQTSAAEAASAFAGDSPLADEIRRLYLVEYASQWEAFLGDIQTIRGETRAFDLQVLRTLAAPDSPLTRLVKAAVRETTLSRRIAAEKSLLERAQEELDRKAGAAAGSLGIRSEVRLERKLVDSRFAALREIVTGEADAGADEPSAGQKGGLEAVNSLINDYYTQLVVADNTLLANGIPLASDAGARLRQEAAKLPAPFRGVLYDLVTEGNRKINAGVGEILISQAEVSLGEYCRKAIEGKFPFAASEQDVDADDFSRLFSAGGLMDAFFEKNLKAYVDTTTTPWRYKQDAPGMPPVAGPPLDAFARAQVIRDAFFREPGGKRMAWKADIRIAEMDPMITALTLDIDGQVQRYAHGPVAPWNVFWPGPKGGAQAGITADPRIRYDTSSLTAQGPWALFRLLEMGAVQATANAGRINVDYDLDGRRVRLDVLGASHGNPLTADLLRGFKCPGRSI
ncbi:type VI secretion system membrane subunit TssM [Thauera sinica]|uniref:Type VI secretion system membrane subunit TssM n=1 Tax=Thauera sinica TaxID=2665146 RepID=A0ABW1AU28_9RHOO|nr:type VI secretion system membrane subunit TssM [Thauera sp. K11]